ncbi:hypothetical protein D3C79_1022450 [compost metagenome]
MQQAQARAGETDWLGLAHEQLHAQALFQLFELMGQGRLGQVQTFCGFYQAVGFAQGVQGFEMANFQHDGAP